MLDCRRVTELCSAEQERPLALGERFALGLHTLQCAGCRNYRRQLDFLRRAAQRYADGELPPDEAPPGAKSPPAEPPPR